MLGSILAGLKAIVNVIGMTKMTPPIKDLLPRLTPILKNRFVNYYNNTYVLGWLVGALNGLLLYLEVVFVVGLFYVAMATFCDGAWFGSTVLLQFIHHPLEWACSHDPVLNQVM